MEIRAELPEDYEAIYDINCEAFQQENEAILVNALRANKNVFVPQLSLIAICEGQKVAHILFTKVSITKDSGICHPSLALAPMAVLPAFQNRGIGTRLIAKGIEIAKELNYTSVVVLGHENYYPRFGFEPALKWNIFPPFDVPHNAFMAMELANNALEGIGGTVIYPPEFNEI